MLVLAKKKKKKKKGDSFFFTCSIFEWHKIKIKKWENWKNTKNSSDSRRIYETWSQCPNNWNEDLGKIEDPKKSSKFLNEDEKAVKRRCSWKKKSFFLNLQQQSLNVSDEIIEILICCCNIVMH